MNSLLRLEIVLFSAFALNGLNYSLAFIYWQSIIENIDLETWISQIFLVIDLISAIFSLVFVRKWFFGENRGKMITIASGLAAGFCFFRSFGRGLFVPCVVIERVLNGVSLGLMTSCVPGVLLSSNSHKAEGIISVLQSFYAGGFFIGSILMISAGFNSYQYFAIILSIFYILLAFFLQMVLKPEEKTTQGKFKSFSLIKKPVLGT
jgi:MFS family permease